MHTAIGLSGLALVVVGSYIQWNLLRSIPVWQRQLLFFLLPLVTPLLILGALFTSFCWQTLPVWDGHVWDDHSLIHFLSWALAAVAVIALAISLPRYILPMLLVARYPEVSDPSLTELARKVAGKLKMRCPTLRLYDSARPLVGVVGGKTILISSWAASALDEEEKEAVLAHEMAHLKRRDTMVLGIAQLIRNVTFYAPALWRIWRRLTLHLETMCDELASSTNRQRLALASALCKVGLQTVSTKRHWTQGIGLLSSPGLSDLRERLSALLSPRPAQRAGRHIVAKSLIVFITIQGLLVASGLHFINHTEISAHAVILGLIWLCVLFWVMLFLRFRKVCSNIPHNQSGLFAKRHTTKYENLESPEGKALWQGHGGVPHPPQSPKIGGQRGLETHLHDKESDHP